jgi:hypothetical protein
MGTRDYHQSVWRGRHNRWLLYSHRRDQGTGGAATTDLRIFLSLFEKRVTRNPLPNQSPAAQKK